MFYPVIKLNNQVIGCFIWTKLQIHNSINTQLTDVHKPSGSDMLTALKIQCNKGRLLLKISLNNHYENCQQSCQYDQNFLRRHKDHPNLLQLVLRHDFQKTFSLTFIENPDGIKFLGHSNSVVFILLPDSTNNMTFKSVL